MNTNTSIILPNTTLNGIHAYELVREANDIEVIQRHDSKMRPLAEVHVNGKFEHTFPHTSRVSRHLDVMPPEMLASRLKGGHFFFVDGGDGYELVDFRDGNYNGWVHTDESIAKFAELLGFQRRAELNLRHLQKRAIFGDETVDESPIVLRKVWNENEIIVPGYAVGGTFDSVLSFAWNPFVKTINTMFDLVRLVCTNGMVGVTSFLNTKVPLVNRWEEHLDIAAIQVQNKVADVVMNRVQMLADTRCSLGDLLLLQHHIATRLESTTDTVLAQNLMNMLNAVSPQVQLGSVYRDQVFENKNLAAQLPGHLSNFDVFNLLTEIRTHMPANDKSTDFALDKAANEILFDREEDFLIGAKRSKEPAMCSFSSPETAFFGDMVAV